MPEMDELAEGTVTSWAGMTRIQASPLGVRSVWLPAWNETTQPGDCAKAAIRIDCGNGAAREQLCQALDELAEYFKGERRIFDVALDLRGPAFHRRAWAAVASVPYGETRSYREIAHEIGAPLAVRAVGAANGANPVAPFVPCHRIVGSDGRLTGYGPGLPLKQRLLAMEGAVPACEADYPAWVKRISNRLGSQDWALGIRATGAFCQPATPHPARLRLVPNRIFASPEAAEAAGFHACPRCW